MTRNQIQATVIEVICRQFGWEPDDVRPEMSLAEDFKADSLDAVEIMMDLEDDFGLAIPDAAAERVHTVKDIVDYIEQRIRARDLRVAH